jgi:two-component system CheB/CheR fusion protein
MELREYKTLTDRINTLNKYSNLAPILSVIAAISVISMTISLYKRLQKNLDVNAALDRERELMKKKDEFLTVASHELKTPLTSMKGYLQILNAMLTKDGGDKYQGFILKANKQADRLNVLVRDLLTVSKINANQIEYHFSEFSFGDIIDDALVFANELSKAHKIQVLGNKEISLIADKGRIEQVVSNLISNAIKYSPDSEDILLTIEKTFDKTLRFSVTDKGIGIDKKKSAFVFDRFYRINEKNYNTSGLGIGLYISAEIIKRHMGQIGLDSRPGKGSTFWFTIPLISGDEDGSELI